MGIFAYLSNKDPMAFNEETMSAKMNTYIGKSATVLQHLLLVSSELR